MQVHALQVIPTMLHLPTYLPTHRQYLFLPELSAWCWASLSILNNQPSAELPELFQTKSSVLKDALSFLGYCQPNISFHMYPIFINSTSFSIERVVNLLVAQVRTGWHHLCSSVRRLLLYCKFLQCTVQVNS